VSALVIALATAAVSAQSLGDVARQEEARRARIVRSSKTITDSSLSADPNGPSQADREKPATSVAPVPGSAADSPAAAVAPVPPAEPAKVVLDEKAWRSRAAGHRARVAAAQKDVDALSGASHPDPREQAKLDASLKRREATLKQVTEAQHLFEMQADVAGVPAAWLK
jgi:hypothetical protein